MQKKLVLAIKQKDFQSFDRLINRSLIRALFPPYNLEYLKLNRYLLEDNKGKIDQQFDLLLRASKKSQKEDIFLKAFEYYAFNQNKKKANKYFEELQKLKNPKITKYVNLIYDVFVLNQSNHIEELEKDFENVSQDQKRFYAQLLFMQYKNINNELKQNYYKEFLKASYEHC
ncbi:MAG TPA: hypothetical protein H9886_03150 [Candidatus Faecalicoccus intestinipullorum]|nr:hypothetical protein [Candidatus Faecalicoccus intestinipullorum]